MLSIVCIVCMLCTLCVLYVFCMLCSYACIVCYVCYVCHVCNVIPQQRKLMGSSAKNSSSVHWCRRRVRFNEVPEKVPKVPEKVPGGFGAEPGQVQQGPGEGWRLWCRARSGSTGLRKRFRRRFREALVQSQVRLNRVPEKVPEKVWEAFAHSQIRFNGTCGHLIHGNPPEVFPRLGFAARFRKICKNKNHKMLHRCG